MNVHRTLRVLAAVCMIGTATAAVADTFPNRPVRVIVPFAPGGSTDQVARLLATDVSNTLGVSVVVENRPGANGNIGAEAVATARPDGYTLLHSTSALGYTAAFKQPVSYDLHNDLTPVSLLVDQPLLIMASKQLGVQNVAELDEYEKENPGTLNYGSSGTGNLTHLGMHVILDALGIEATHIPYKGGSSAFPDFIAGRIDLFADPINSASSYVTAGRVTALAVTSESRSAMLPDVPTVSEAVLPGFQMGAWQALMAPGGTSDEIIQRINAAYQKALSNPEIVAQLSSQGAEAIGSSPEEFEKHLNDHVTQWQQVIETSGITLD